MNSQRIIHKIINYIDSILKYINKITYEEFIVNSMMIEACVFNLSQIGELVNKLDKEYILKYPEVPWIKMKGILIRR
ncbi:MAG TPA: hypothetical protein DC038_13205 [Clostridiales bacterium]|nr:hypothetical protein [Clostridiales bacterium]